MTQGIESQSIEPQFHHRFVPATQPDPGITLLLLHGTGGNEEDLLPLGRELLPGAALLSPRGRVLENGMPRFFRRFAEGVFDIDDLKFQTNALNDFIKAAAQHYGLTQAHRASSGHGARHQSEPKMVAVGYSNGANIAASPFAIASTCSGRRGSISRDGAVYARFRTESRAHLRASQWRHARSDCSPR